MRVKGVALFSFAGLWSLWQGPGGLLESFAVITTAASGELAHIHDRMPVIIGPDEYGIWLDEGGGDLLRPCALEMEAYPVAKLVNNPRNQGEALAQPLG